ncbi:MAG: hypothetical protein R3B47_00150 [Bacteroidia bacterium]
MRLLPKAVLLVSCWMFLASFVQQPEGEPLPLEWPVLAMVKYKPYQTPGMAGGEKPEPGQVIRRLEHKLVSIRGYVIPLDIDGNSYMLSALPNASCFFFCGKAGMESVMELRLKKAIENLKWMKSSHFRSCSSMMTPYGLMYLLLEAEEM